MRKTTSILSKEERTAHAGLLQNLVKNTILNVNIWNSKGQNYAQLNQLGKCLVHEDKLRKFLLKANLANRNIFLEFSASEWDRCRDHGPAEELVQFLLELPQCYDDHKVSLTIDQTGEVQRFDLNMLMYKIAVYRPELVFREVTLKGNFDQQSNSFAEGIDILFSKARRLSLNNLNVKAVAFHKVPKQTLLKSLSMRNVILEQGINNDDRFKMALPAEVQL